MMFETDARKHVTTTKFKNFVGYSNHEYWDQLLPTDRFIILLNSVIDGGTVYLKMTPLMFSNLGMKYHNQFDSRKSKFGSTNLVLSSGEGELELDTHPYNEIWMLGADHVVRHRIVFTDFRPLKSRIKYIHVSATVESPEIKGAKVITASIYKKTPDLKGLPYRRYFRAYGGTMWLEMSLDIKACSKLDDPNIGRIISDGLDVLNKDFRSRSEETDFDEHEGNFVNYENPNDDFVVFGTNNILHQGIVHTSSECMCDYCQLD
jgi:hypothetical protein